MDFQQYLDVLRHHLHYINGYYLCAMIVNVILMLNMDYIIWNQVIITKPKSDKLFSLNFYIILILCG